MTNTPWRTQSLADRALDAMLSNDKVTRRMAIKDRLPDGTPYGQPEGEVTHPDDLVGVHGALHTLAKDVMDQLAKRYRGFMWGVQPDGLGHVINIFCLNLNRMWGFTIKVKDIQDDPRRKLAIRAGKEILRRFRYPYDQYNADAVAALARDATGDCIPDLSDFKGGKRRQQSEIDLAIAEGRANIITDGYGQQILEITR